MQMVISQFRFRCFCWRRTLEYVRRAVYCRDAETHGRLSRMATAWAELALAVDSSKDSAALRRSLANFFAVLGALEASRVTNLPGRYGLL